MDTRVSDLFGTVPTQRSSSQGANNGAVGLASRKSSKNGKKCKNRPARYPKASNNPPYLPPEVSLTNLKYITHPSVDNFCFKETFSYWLLVISVHKVNVFVYMGV